MIALPIVMLVAFVIAIGFAAADEDFLSTVFAGVSLVCLIVLTGFAVVSQHNADMDTRAANCAVMWEGFTTEGSAIAHVADVCNIDRGRAADLYYGVVAEFTAR